MPDPRSVWWLPALWRKYWRGETSCLVAMVRLFSNRDLALLASGSRNDLEWCSRWHTVLTLAWCRMRVYCLYLMLDEASELARLATPVLHSRTTAGGAKCDGSELALQLSTRIWFRLKLSVCSGIGSRRCKNHILSGWSAYRATDIWSRARFDRESEVARALSVLN